ncbi:hypothetical protein J2Z66_007482 [Paenibacillus eucommiae]|uniref:Transposase n=1 Tax=Paenibacillus eucommiae TaxID=1355755 RepID=A0ABS4J7M3_9BACL|nr:hypothetical protein [Paenibacillus eucommiae]
MAFDKPASYGFSMHALWNLEILTKAVLGHIPGPTMSRSSVHRTLQRV